MCWIPAQRPFKFCINPAMALGNVSVGTSVPVARDGTDEGEDKGSVDKHCKSAIGFEGLVTACFKVGGVSHDHHGVMT